MDSNYMKAMLFRYFRFNKQARYIATECGPYNSDMLVAYKKELIEIEIKTSIADFKADFKKAKHEYYTTGKICDSMTETVWLKDQHGKNVLENGRYIKVGKQISKQYVNGKPNLFLFVVPLELVDKATLFLKSNYPLYGLLSVSGTHSYKDSGIKTVIRPKKIHNQGVNPWVKEVIVSRMASEIANLRFKLLEEKNGKNQLNED
jgi:hypothetical protein